MSIVYLALGSNLSDRRALILGALDLLRQKGVKILKTSSLIETEPVGGPIQGKFLNAVVKAQTDLEPFPLLDLIHHVEWRLGRVREVRNGPRLIDIDILLYDDIKLVTKRLVIPHPRMMERDFVLKPLKEIDPQLCALLTRKIN